MCAGLFQTKKGRQQEGGALLFNHAQQPSDVVASRTKSRMQSVTLVALEATAIHAVIGVEVADDEFDCLAPPEQLSVLLNDPLGLAPVLDVHIRVIGVHPPVAQIDEIRRWFRMAVLHQDRDLFQLFAQRVTAVRIDVEGLGTDDQVAVQRASDAQLHAELMVCLTLPLEIESTSGASQA